MSGLPECSAEFSLRVADLSDGGSEFFMQISDFSLASASSAECSAEFFFPSAS
jgi:hypothetical protein